MKLALLILLFPALLKAQDSVKRHKLPMIALITTSVITGAISDGLNSRTKYTAGHSLAVVSWASLIALPFVVKPNWKFPVTYLLVRYALFDGFYNLGAKRKLNYIGGKNYYDESAGRIPLGVFNATKIASLGFTVIINLK